MRRSTGLLAAAAAASTVAAVGVLVAYYYHQRLIDETETEGAERDDLGAESSKKTEKTPTEETSKDSSMEVVSLKLSPERSPGPPNDSKLTTPTPTNISITTNNNTNNSQSSMRSKCATTTLTIGNNVIAVQPIQQRNIVIKGSANYASKVQLKSTFSHGKSEPLTIMKTPLGSKSDLKWLAAVEAPECLVFAEQDEQTIVSDTSHDDSSTQKRLRVGTKKRLRLFRGRWNSRNWSFRSNQRSRHRAQTIVTQQNITEIFV